MAAGLALVTTAGLMLGVAPGAQALAQNSWSDAEKVGPISPGAGVYGRVTQTDDGTLWMIAAARNGASGNAYGLMAYSTTPGTPFPASPLWLVNDPSAVDTNFSVEGRDLKVFTDGNDVIVVWLAGSDMGIGQFYLGGVRYTDGAWTTPDYVALTAINMPAGWPGFALAADGSVAAVYSDSTGTVQSADFQTDGTWTASTAIPGATYNTNGYQNVSVAVADDGTVWSVYPGVNTPMATSRSGGVWSTPEPVRGASANADYDPAMDDAYALGLTASALGEQRPIVVVGESGAGSTTMYVRQSDGTWSSTLVTDSAVSVYAGALAVAPDGSMALAVYDYNLTESVLTFTSSSVDAPWSDATVVAAPGLNYGGYTFDVGTDGDLIITIPKVVNTGSDFYGEIYMSAYRSGSGVFTDPTLISRETSTTDNQGAASVSANPDLLDAFLPVAWTSYSDSSASDYQLFWQDASGEAPAPPSAPTGLTGTAAATSVDLVWAAPASAGSSAISDYQVRFSSDGGLTWSDPQSLGSTSTTATVTGLTNGTDYVFQVRAVNAAGTGPWSAPSNAVAPKPAGTAPARPQRPTVLAGRTKVTVTVSRGAGGGTPVSFTVTAQPGGRTCTVAATTTGSCSITGLSRNTIYTFTAVATNAAGHSPKSLPSGGARIGAPVSPGSASVPGPVAPGGSVLTVNGAPATVSSSPNSKGNGLEVEGIDFTMTLDGLKANGEPMNLGPDGELILANERDVQTSGDGFMPNTDVLLYVDPPVAVGGRAGSARAKGIYIGTVRTDATGSFTGVETLPATISQGRHTLQAAGVTPGNLRRNLTLGVVVADSPGAVRDLAATRGVARGSVILDWKAPANDGGSSIRSYGIAYRPVVASGWVAAGRAQKTTATMSDLVPGCRYEVRVRAVNATGSGPWSVTTVYVAPRSRMRLPAGDLRCLVR